MREITIKTEEDNDFIYTRSAHYYETDQMGIIHHSNYIRWFEEARMAYMDAYGLNYALLEQRKILIPVLSAECNYKKLVRYGDTVDIKVKISNIRGIKFELEYTVLNHLTGELHATGKTGHCFLNDKLAPFRLKKEAPDVYEFFTKLVER